MKSRILIIALLVVVASTVAFVTIRRHATIGTSAAATATAEGDRHGPKRVEIAGLETAPVIQEPVTQLITVTGEVQADEEHLAKIGSPVAGRLVQLVAKVGQCVRQGQTLAVVASRDVAEVQSALTRARAEEQTAATRLHVVRDLAQTGALTQKPLEEAHAAYTAAQAAEKQAEAALARTRSARDLANAALMRTRRLAAVNAFQARPVEDAKGVVAKVEAELETAQAAVKVRQAAYDRSRRLFDAGIAARRDVENAEADLAEATAQLRAAHTHLDLARQTLAREQSIANQGLYTSAEVQTAENALRQAEREVDSCTAELTRAGGQLTQTRAVFTREQAIAQRNLNARQTLQEAESTLIRARADVQATENGLRALHAAGGPRSGKNATLAIVAPITGVITERQATPGQAVEATTDLFTIVNTDYVWVWANVYEKDLAQIRVGERTDVMITTFPGTVFAGTVTYIGTELKAETRTARIRCAVANPQGRLKVGMFATVNLATGHNRQALLIPKTAVLDDASKKIVFTPCMDCAEDKATGRSVCGSFDRLEVVLGAIHGDRVEVAQGLQPGIKVVTTGQYQLKTALGSGKLKAGCCD